MTAIPDEKICSEGREMEENNTVSVIVHGGAWSIPDALVVASRNGVRLAAGKAYQTLLDGGTALDAVQIAVHSMEDDPVFDAGVGSVLTADGNVEMDAVIMSGADLNAGGVACLQNIAHPIEIARLVMDKTPHTLLVGPGANQFAAEQGIKTVPTSQLVTEAAESELTSIKRQFNKAVDQFYNTRDALENLLTHCDTVGAVALDSHGNVAFATSTGGISGKRTGRVGDSPIIGAGGYADNDVGAVSSTGHGESISKVCLAHLAVTSLRRGSTVNDAIRQALDFMKQRVGGCGGLIAVDSKTGDVAHYSTTDRMAWASCSRGVLQYGIESDDSDVTTEQI